MWVSQDKRSVACSALRLLTETSQQSQEGDLAAPSLRISPQTSWWSFSVYEFNLPHHRHLPDALLESSQDQHPDVPSP